MQNTLYAAIIIALLSYAAQNLWFMGTDMILVLTEDVEPKICEDANDIEL